jgi:hypothetical protein
MTPHEEANSLREVIAGLPERHRDGPLGDALRARLARLDRPVVIAVEAAELDEGVRLVMSGTLTDGETSRPVTIALDAGILSGLCCAERPPITEDLF